MIYSFVSCRIAMHVYYKGIVQVSGLTSPTKDMQEEQHSELCQSHVSQILCSQEHHDADGFLTAWTTGGTHPRGTFPTEFPTRALRTLPPRKKGTAALITFQRHRTGARGTYFLVLRQWSEHDACLSRQLKHLRAFLKVFYLIIWPSGSQEDNLNFNPRPPANSLVNKFQSPEIIILATLCKSAPTFVRPVSPLTWMSFRMWAMRHKCCHCFYQLFAADSGLSALQLEPMIPRFRCT
ncbi:hypothetical protein DUNSADRAFT_16511 [Dunaliella salina]|uniref:Encoded protein n=1 Tax=Dunaliella salina TaxID=3046 RepID=A0ABQ7G3G7_DUNSA|nr:hypothetical protein DUNSADRAFT_16511 [Dunaliella salina]|eukprot:KAF5829140.1 hypothetical protein DUNSADRAFT_16511 [Dunaliella salina]